MKLSDNLKIIRKENNLSQEQLAEKLGVSRQAVSKWESGQSYPEMDKVLLICKLFNYNIDELMNENVKEVEESKQSKININKYIDDFFGFITKTVDMLSSMTFKEKCKCIIEQIFIGIFLVVIFAIIAMICSSILTGIISGLPTKAFSIIANICESIYILLALIIGITILLHIFKVRYLDYYEIVKNDNEPKENEDEEISSNADNKKIVIENNKQKVVIRDPDHSESRFLNGIIRIVLWCIKFVVSCFAIGFVFTLIALVVALVISFLFVKTGLVFVGTLIGLIGAIIMNIIILEICYNFIISKKSKKTRILIECIISIILIGIGIGAICIGITDFNYIEDTNYEKEEVYEMPMTDNLSIDIWNDYIEYVETDSNIVKIVVKHSKYSNVDISNEDETINIYFFQNNGEVMEGLRDIINDINNKEIKNYNEPKVYVYASRENIEKMKQNQQEQYERSKSKEIDDLTDENERLENEISNLQDIISEKDEEIENLKQYIFSED